MIILLLTALAGSACEHFSQVLADTYIEAEAGDKYAQTNIALHEMACEATLRQEYGDLNRWDCVINLQPGAAQVCEFEVDL